jgi:LmbE family N-acetylglucosaminyl deacetylase
LNAGEFFASLKTSPVIPWQELTRSRPFVVLSPHPDDESLGTGGLVALARRSRQDVSIVLLTDGSGSHPRSASYPRERLIATRQAELEEAGRILGLAPNCTCRLGLPDTAAPMNGPLFERAVTTIVEIARKVGATTLFVTWRGDPHRDHEAAALLAEEVRRRSPFMTLWAYPIWGWHLDVKKAVDPAPRGYRIDISAVQPIKRAAIEAHVSQMTDLISDDPCGFRFTETTLIPFLGAFEYFIEVPA